MLMPPVALACVCVALGFMGAILAYKGRRTVLVPVAVVLAVASITIYRLRDPLGIPARYRPYTQSWDYVLALYSSFAIGVTLPIIGA